LVGSLFGLTTAHPVVAAVVDKGLSHREELVEVRFLLGDTDQLPCLHRRVEVPEDPDLAAAGSQKVADSADQGRLACAVRSEQTEEAAGRDLQVEAVECKRAVVVALAQSLDF